MKNTIFNLDYKIGKYVLRKLQTKAVYKNKKE